MPNARSSLGKQGFVHSSFIILLLLAVDAITYYDVDCCAIARIYEKAGHYQGRAHVTYAHHCFQYGELCTYWSASIASSRLEALWGLSSLAIATGSIRIYVYVAYVVST